MTDSIRCGAMSRENVEWVLNAYEAADPLVKFADRIAANAAGSLHFEPEQVFDVDEDRVLVVAALEAGGLR